MAKDGCKEIKRCSSDFLFPDFSNNHSSGWLVESSSMAVEKMKHQQRLHSCWTSSIPIPHPLLNLKMFVGTWNVGGKPPHGGLGLREWLCGCSTSPPPDIYVLGFQEIVPLNARNVFGPEDKGPSTTWLSLIGQALNHHPKSTPESTNIYTNATAGPTCSSPTRTSFSHLLSMDGEAGFIGEELACRFPTGSACDGDDYRLVASRQMVGIFLCVWIRTRLVRHVANIRMSCVGTGIMGYLGNKGAVSISMTLRRSTFCFVCTHLASGEKEGDELKRNLDVAEILRRTKFAQSPRFSRPTSTILEHDKIVWFGDLNYRLVPGWRGDALELLQGGDWQALFERDQLRVQQRSGQALSGWEEGSICFPPTYKYVPNSDRYVAAAAAAAAATKSGAKRRTPAWCDRILWRGKGMKQILYSRKELRFSDHRPVYSLFSIDDDDRQGTPPPATSTAANSSSSSCSRVQAEELLLFTRTRSCCSIQTSRFHLVSS